MKSTKVELAMLLVEKQKRLRTRSMNLANVIAKAQAGEYHDWESGLDLPKTRLVADLQACRGVDLADIIEAVKEGEYDEEPTVMQLEELRMAVGPEEFDRLFKGEKRGKA